MAALGFDSCMWDPEYSNSELRAVKASGESQDELCPSTPADTAETSHDSQRLTSGARMTSVAVSQRSQDKKYCCDYP